MKIDISIIVCTYNSPKLIQRCLNSILNQKLKEKIEILLIDGGSNKKTLNILKDYENKHKEIKLIKNPGKLPEGYGKGKWLGFKKSRGAIFGIIDQDNELIGEDCLAELIKPFEEKEIFGSACRLYLDVRDSLTNQTIALIGTDPFVAYRSLDYLVNTNKLNSFLENKKDYFVLNLKADNLVATGGNCFFYRLSALKDVGGYIQDIDTLYKLVKKGYTKIAIPKKAFTHHNAIKNFSEFIKKKKKWGSEYTEKNREFSWIPKTKLERREFIRNLFDIIAIFPMFAESYFRSIKSRKIQWFFVPILKYLTFLIYLNERISTK